MTDIDHELVHRERAWQEWRVERERQLAEPLGVLSQVALHWLGPESERFAGLPGEWRAGDGGAEVTATADDGLVLLSQARALAGTVAVAVAEAGAVRFVRFGAGIEIEVVRRTGRYGLRVYDPAAPALRAFAGLGTYAFDPSWVIDAEFRPYAEPRPVRVDGAQPGLVHDRLATGEVSFERDGAEHTLQVFGDHGTTILFHDTTNGAATAPWRVLPVELNGAGPVQLDFNRAANLPFAFTPFGTCPRPPAGNDLPFGVTAGEWNPAARGGDRG